MANLDMSKFTILLVGIVVSTVLVTGVLIPVISDSMSSEGYENIGDMYFTATGSHEIDFDFTKDGDNITILMKSDGTELSTITFDVTSYYNFFADHGFEDGLIAYGDDWIIMYSISSNGFNNVFQHDFNLYFNTQNENHDYSNGFNLNTTTETTIRFVMNNSSITIYGDDEPVNETPIPNVKGFKVPKGELVLSEQPIVMSNTVFATLFDGEMSMGTITDNAGISRDITAEYTTESVGDAMEITSCTAYYDGNDTNTVSAIGYIVPAKIGGGGISPTMAVVISLVPFILILGIAMLTINQLIKRE